MSSVTSQASDSIYSPVAASSGLTVPKRGAYIERLAKVAQLVEHSSEKAGVAGSSPALGTTLSSAIEKSFRKF